MGHSANDLYWFVLPLIMPSLLVKFDLTYALAGAILTLYLTITSVFSYIMGKTSDTLGRYQIISIGFFVASSGFLVAGFANHLSAFLIIISFTAIGVSTFHPIMYAIIDESPLTNSGKVLGIYETFGTAAILMMFIVNGFLIDSIGVRGILIITSIPGFIMGICFFQEHRRQMTRFTIQPSAKNDIIDTPITQPILAIPKSESCDLEKHEPKGQLWTLIIFLFSVIFRMITVSAILNFLPVIIFRTYGVTQEIASYTTALFFAGGILGSLSIGGLSKVTTPLQGLLVETICIPILVLLMSMQVPFYLTLSIIFFFGFFASGCYISQNLFIRELNGRKGKGELFGILTGVLTLTSAISPYLIGVVFDNLGIHIGIMVFSMPAVVSCMLLIILASKGRVISSKPVRA